MAITNDNSEVSHLRSFADRTSKNSHKILPIVCEGPKTTILLHKTKREIQSTQILIIFTTALFWEQNQSTKR